MWDMPGVKKNTIREFVLGRFGLSESAESHMFLNKELISVSKSPDQTSAPRLHFL